MWARFGIGLRQALLLSSLNTFGMEKMNLFKWRSGNKLLAPLHKVTSDVITTKRRNWQSGSFRIQRTKHSGNTGVPCLEDTSASSSSSANDDAPWRVGKSRRVQKFLVEIITHFSVVLTIFQQKIYFPLEHRAKAIGGVQTMK